MKNIPVYHNCVLSKKFFCIDIETTGLDPESDTAGILEVYYKIMKTTPLCVKTKKIKEGYGLFYHDHWKDTQNIHQIEESELVGKPTFVESEDFKKELKDLFLQCCDPDNELTFMAHYSPFEYKWFMQFLDFSDEEEELMKNIKTCDPRYIAKFLYPNESHSLIPMCKKFSIKPPNGQHDFHRADQDVNAMFELYRKLRRRIKTDVIEYNSSNYAFDFNEKHD